MAGPVETAAVGFGSMLWRRRISQTVAILVFFAVPLLNLFRVDLVERRFYLYGRSFPFGAVNPIGVPILVIIVVAFLLAFIFVLLPAVNLVAERGFCGWFCPQTMLSEVGELSGVANWQRHLFPGRGGRLTRGRRLPVWARVVLGTAVALILAFGFTSYLVGPSSILHSLTAFG